MNKSKSPDCYACGWRRNIFMESHSRCVHPDVGRLQVVIPTQSLADTDTRAIPYSKNCGPMMDLQALELLNIKFEQSGFEQGWFNWPWNFDPHWLKGCYGFTPKRVVCQQCKQSLVCVVDSVEVERSECWRDHERGPGQNKMHE